MKKYNFTKKSVTILLMFFYSTDTTYANWPDQVTMAGGYHMMGTGMDWITFLLWSLVLGILIFVIYWVLKLPQGEKLFPIVQTTASQILKERFERGEIDIAEFELKKQIIDN